MPQLERSRRTSGTLARTVDLRTLRVVVAIAEQGSITRAAGSLHQSSSAVSHALVSLEAELGVDLFHRLPRGMALTDAGRVFVAAARRTLHEAEVTRRSVDAIRGVIAGQVNVATVVAYSSALADLIGEFARRHPGVMVRILPMESADDVVQLVRNGDCELGFMWAAVAVPADLERIVEWFDPFVIVVPERHRLAAQRSAAIEDLRGERVVAPVASSTMLPLFDALFSRRGIEPQVVAESPSVEMLLELVRAGVGCTVTVASNAALVAGRGAVALEAAYQPDNTMQLVTRTPQNPTPAARAFCEVAVQRFASLTRGQSA